MTDAAYANYWQSLAKWRLEALDRERTRNNQLWDLALILIGDSKNPNLIKTSLDHMITILGEKE